MHTILNLTSTFADPAATFRYTDIRGFTGHEIATTLDHLRDEKSHRDFRKKTESAVLEAIDCPAVAACVLFHRLADENPRERARARALIRERLDGIVPEAQLDDVMAYSSWVADQLVDPSEPMHHFRPLWLKRLTHAERVQLIEIAEAVTEANGYPTERQLSALRLLRRALGD